MKRLLPVLMGFALLLLSSTEGWSLPSCPADNHISTWTDCFGSKTFDWGSYVGEWKNGRFHGSGTATSPVGRKYVGDWKNGKYHGFGTETYNRVLGESVRVKCTRCTLKFGDKYVGEFKNGKWHGKGTLTTADGRVVKEGIWKNDKFLYAQKVSPNVTARKSPPPSPSAAEIENERLRRENARLKILNQILNIRKQVAKRTLSASSDVKEGEVPCSATLITEYNIGMSAGIYVKIQISAKNITKKPIDGITWIMRNKKGKILFNETWVGANQRPLFNLNPDHVGIVPIGPGDTSALVSPVAVFNHLETLIRDKEGSDGSEMKRNFDERLNDANKKYSGVTCKIVGFVRKIKLKK